MGYGRTGAEFEAGAAGIARFIDDYSLQSLFGLSRMLGADFVRVEHENDFALALVDLSFRDMQVPARTVALIKRRSLGFRDTGDEEPLITSEVNWMVDRETMVSAGMDPEEPGSDPGYWATIATVLQAVPRVCAAPPGILRPVLPDLHWMPDFRDLAV
ncbi:hypothetical protein [Streptomyces sp. NPDC005799]|uniref:hypothetical protein n=1 Tax=Streptomyces sp. NPDC005799 TaxID=3154678 RepID=UPI003407B188